ncbi:MAG: hypothetical protein COZ49_00095 [Candidatus Yonathbacteria bacterium CG_4_10_14_3_um_filter_47_65]|uniref:Transposase IS200-like domain-containing protein n=1 Tax=Candidatus Nomurabacteria bacterium CG1_02_47_685 TaxID=1805282 RepID=A0A1J4V8N9_9BACT
MRIRNLCHSCYQHQYHLVWGTKYRRKYLKEYVKVELIKNFKETIKNYPTLRFVEINTDEDHVHLQVEIPPDLTVAAVVRILKSKSSFVLKKKFKFIREMYLDSSIWSVGYFSSTIGLNEKQIRDYIEWQGKKDLQKTIEL